MTTGKTTENQIKLDTPTQLAFERTRVAYDRTLMASVRTATSLITFGFTVYKFFQLELPGKDKSFQIIGARGFGLIMICIGLLSLLISAIEYRKYMRNMRKEYCDMPRSSTGLVAGLIALLGILALLVLILRM
jgi:putative membrane protein